MPDVFGPNGSSRDLLQVRLIATILVKWTQGVSDDIVRDYLTRRGLDTSVQARLVESAFWKATQETLRTDGRGWLEAAKGKLSEARSSFERLTDVQTFEEWSRIERDDAMEANSANPEVTDTETMGLWNRLHTAQARSWGVGTKEVEDYRDAVAVYPSSLFERGKPWEALDAVAEAQYVLSRKQALAQAATEEPLDFEAAHFIFLAGYPEIVREAHKMRPNANASELRDYAWGFYRTVRAPKPTWRSFSSNVSKAVATYLLGVAKNEAQSKRAKKRPAQ